MKPEELPEDSLTESLLQEHKELIDKYFDGEVPTEKRKKEALAFLARTSLAQQSATNTYYDYTKWYQ
jgi:hypothetical protein